MKKIKAIIPAALALAAVSCSKEFIPQPEIVSDGKTFTCTFEGSGDVKTGIDENNTPLWEAGDFIILYNGANANTQNKSNQATFQVLEDSADGILFYVTNNGVREAVTNNIVEKIDITADMISADGKTVTFTKTIDDAQSTYYAFAEQKGAHLVYSINSSGKVTLRESKNHTASVTKLVHAAVATCSADATSLSFKNIYSQVKFDVSVGKYQRVTFEANAGSTNTFVCGMANILFDASSMGTASNKTDPYTITLNNTGEGPFYVPVASTAVLDKGITIKCYKSASDTEPYVISTKKSFPLARNRMINLGNLDGLKPVTSYYESYQAGDDIVINGVRYNKSQYGEGTLITDDTEWNNSTTTDGGVFFLAEGVTLTNKQFKPRSNVIIMSDKPGTRSKFVLSGSFIPQAGNLKFIFYRLDFEAPTNYLFYGASYQIQSAGIYDCKMQINSNYFKFHNSLAVIRDSEIADCDIKTTIADFGMHLGNLPESTGKYENISFRNNIVYSSDATVRTFRIFRESKDKIKSVAGKITVDNNTFYNIIFVNGLVSPVSLDEIQLNNNIFAYSAVYSTYQRCLQLSTDPGNSATAIEGYPSEGSVRNNISFNASSRVLGVMNPSVNLAGMSWYPTDYKEVTNASEDPFSVADLTSGTFTQKPAFASYGAKR